MGFQDNNRCDMSGDSIQQNSLQVGDEITDDGKLVFTTRPLIPPYKEHPTLSTSDPRVSLRPFQANDLDALHELRSQIEVMKWTSTGKVDTDINATRTWMHRFMEIEDELQHTSEAQVQVQIEKISSKPPGGLNFVVVYHGDVADDNHGSHAHGKVIGAAGIHSVDPEPECGYMIRKEYWNRGITTTVVKSFLDAWWKLDRINVRLLRSAGKTISVETDSVGDEHDDDQEVEREREALNAEIDASNIASQRVLEKCGFMYDYTREKDDEGIILKHFKQFRPLS